MKDAAKDWKTWTYEETVSNKPTLADGDVVPSSLFGHIAFETRDRFWEPLKPDPGRYPGDIPYLRPPDQSPEQETPKAEEMLTLAQHPVAYRTFAAFPPTAGVYFDMFIPEEVRNPTGVTVHDVLIEMVPQ